VLVATGGENVTDADRAEIEAAFGVPLRENYGSLEFPRFAWSCLRGRLHVSADWVILEAVDEHDLPVPPGEPSATVLVTNLANRIQPIIRYDLGDMVTMPATPCPCGNPLPTVSVQGRSAEVIKLRSSRGEAVSLLPLPLSRLVGDSPGVHRYQIEQAGASALSVHLEARPEASREAVWQTILGTLREHLNRHGLDNVSVELSPDPPRIQQKSGKLKTIHANVEGSAESDDGSPASSTLVNSRLPDGS
jgi:phenylacetate-coenzyme A ligase PaaK-like adenylate-forming protein